MDFAVLANNWVKVKETEKKDKCLDLARELKTMGHESQRDTICNWCACNSHQRIDTNTGGLENKWTSGHHQITASLRSPRILIRFVDTWGDCSHLNSCEKLSVSAGLKKTLSNELNNNNNNNNNNSLGWPHNKTERLWKE